MKNPFSQEELRSRLSNLEVRVESAIREIDTLKEHHADELARRDAELSRRDAEIAELKLERAELLDRLLAKNGFRPVLPTNQPEPPSPPQHASPVHPLKPVRAALRDQQEQEARANAEALKQRQEAAQSALQP